MGWLYLGLSLVGAGLTLNVWRPPVSHRHVATASWLFGWLTGELALHWIFAQAAVTLGFAWLGAFDSLAGQVGLGVSAVSWLGLLGAQARAHRSGSRVEAALHDAFGTDAGPRASLDWRRIAAPIPRPPASVEVLRGLQFARVRGANLRLDLYRPRTRSDDTPRPMLLQVHGGGWVTGDRQSQGLPLMHTLAERGWVCASVDYRLSPAATFPDHIVDVKRGLAWLRQNAAEYGGDPDFIVVTGGSAGGQLAALVAVSPNLPEFQPGFEDVDTTVQGCIAFYGVYDMADRARDWPNDGLRRVLERQVMKGSVEELNETYDEASPLRQLTPDAPPFFVIHGDTDSLVPVEQSRRFVMKLREVSRELVLSAEIPGAQHAFEMFWSARTLRVVDGAARFAEQLARRRAVPEADRREATG